MSRINGHLPPPSNNTDLAVFLFLRRRPKRHEWAPKKIRAFVRGYTKGATVAALGKSLKMGKSGCVKLAFELKRAAQAGYTLDRYLQEGRPLRAGKRILAA